MREEKDTVSSFHYTQRAIFFNWSYLAIATEASLIIFSVNTVPVIYHLKFEFCRLAECVAAAD